jgi:outer membrane cobalamin receptor
MAKGISMKVFGAMIFLLTATAWSLMAQQVTIKGKVIDVNDTTALAGVTVAVGAEAGGFTDSLGTFELSVKRAPEIQVLFRFDGKDTIITVVTEPGLDSYTLRMALGKKQDFTLDVTTITESRFAKNLASLTGSMDVINQKKVDNMITGNIEDALVQNSGVDIIDGQPNIRGSSGYAYGVGSRVMVMLDGLPLLSPDAGFVQFDLIPTDNIAQIEVMKGASSVLYGSSALGGVINVIMADAPSTPKTSIRLRGQGYDAPSDERLDWDGKKFAKSGGINVFHSRKIGIHDFTALVDLSKDSGFRHGTGSTEGRLQVLTKFRSKKAAGLSYGVNASVRFDSSTTFLFWDSYLPADTFYPFASNEPVVGSLGAYSGQGSARSQLKLRYTVDPFIKFLTKKNNLHYYHGRYMRTDNTNNTNQSSHNSLFYNDYQFSTHLWENRINWVSGATVSFGLANGDSLYGGRHYSVNTAVYTQFDAKLTSKLNVALGGRFDNWNIDGGINEYAPIFRAGANYEFVKGTNVRGSFGQAFRSPSIAERYTNTFASGLTIAPNPDLLVEKGFSAELGFRQGFLAGTKSRGILGYVDVAGFTMNYNNMIEFGVKPPVGEFDPFNLETVFWAKNYAHARITGIEATAMAQYTRDKFSFDLNGGITYIQPVNLNPGDDSMQVDLLNTLGPQSNPFTFAAFEQLGAMFSQDTLAIHRTDNPKVLKYRSRWLNRLSATVGYGGFSLTCNYRYKSAVEAIDQFLYVAIPGSADFVLSHPKGYSLVDFIANAQITKAMQLSVSVKNAFNTEYVILPGIIGEQRAFAFQVKYVF